MPSPTKSKLLSYLSTNWSKDPFSYGSYSYFASGSGEQDRKNLLAPVGDQVYFAGEALNANYQSSVHAAHESGLEVAKRILKTKHKRIAIIGAGMSGLSAAQLLSSMGKDAVVFEGRDRIGGRILTDRSLGTALDLGASWIHGPDGNPISKLADKAGLSRIPTDDEFVIRGKGGRSMWQMFAPEWLWNVFYQTPTGTELDKLNLEEVEAQFDKYGYGYPGRDVKFPNGYDEILPTLEGDYEVKLSTPISKIAYSTKGVQIGLESGELGSFDDVIVTVPLGVLKKGVIDFDPVLPQYKLDAISRMGMGTLDKTYLLFEERFWDEDATVILTPENDLPQGQFNYWVNFEKYLKKPILMGFNAGESALAVSEMSDEEVVKRALQTLDLTYS